MTILPLTSRVELEQKRQEQLETIKSGISKIKSELSKRGNKVLLIGATALAGYLIFRLFFGRTKEVVFIPASNNESDAPAPNIETVSESPIVAAIRGYIISFLLSLAKQKIQQYLEVLYTKDDGNDLQRTD